jgi:hypothetical protein
MSVCWRLQGLCPVSWWVHNDIDSNLNRRYWRNQQAFDGRRLCHVIWGMTTIDGPNIADIIEIKTMRTWRNN